MNCWTCGKYIETEITQKDQKLLDSENYKLEDLDRIFRADKSKRHYCPECKKEHEQSYAKKVAEYRSLRNEIMLERAIRIFERQKENVYEYKAAIGVVEEFIAQNTALLKTDEWKTAKCFDSADEVATAIVLVANRIQTTIQKEVAGYSVDFLLPELKIVLEIDGELFHKGHELHESRRDAKIRQALGPDWEVVRIKTGYIHKNIKQLPEAIISVKEERQRTRRLHGEYLPL